jgi:hypothetical protein
MGYDVFVGYLAFGSWVEKKIRSLKNQEPPNKASGSVKEKNCLWFKKKKWFVFFDCPLIGSVTIRKSLVVLWFEKKMGFQTQQNWFVGILNLPLVQEKKNVRWFRLSHWFSVGEKSLVVLWIEKKLGFQTQQKWFVIWRDPLVQSKAFVSAVGKNACCSWNPGSTDCFLGFW